MLLLRNTYPVRVLNFYTVYRLLDYSVLGAIRMALKAAR